MTNEKLLTVGQLALFLQVSEETVRRYTRSGDLKCAKLGRQLRFSKAHIEEFIHRFSEKDLPDEEPEYPQDSEDAFVPAPHEDEAETDLHTTQDNLTEGEYL